MPAYGSSEVLEEWLDSVLVLPLEGPVISVLEDSDGVCWYEEKPVSRQITFADFDVIDFSNLSFPPLEVSVSPFVDYQDFRDLVGTAGNIGLLWARIKHQDTCSETSTSSHEIEEVDEIEPPFLCLLAPKQVSASSLCSLCQTPLIHSLLRSAPGYC